MRPLLINQVMIGSNLNTTFPVNLIITSNYNPTTLILIATVVVVLCVAVIMITALLIVRRYTQQRNRKYHLNEIVAELEHRNINDKLSISSKSMQLLFWF